MFTYVTKIVPDSLAKIAPVPRHKSLSSLYYYSWVTTSRLDNSIIRVRIAIESVTCVT